MQVRLMANNPHRTQARTFRYLGGALASTVYGQSHGINKANAHNYGAFASRLPVVAYEELYPHIERTLKGERDLLWPGTTKWFAKSSGTTNARSKFIPVTMDALYGCHFRAGRHLTGLTILNNPHSRMTSGKVLVLGGSHQIAELNENAKYGDLSAVINQNLPRWAQAMRTPSLATSLMDGWEKKLERIAAEAMQEDVVAMAGVPTWTLVLMNYILEKTGGQYITDLWPNLELYTHGGVNFAPYKSQFERVLGPGKVLYQETYNASEGFFGFQDSNDATDLLLLIDYGIFYEFIEASQVDSQLDAPSPTVIPLEDVRLGVNYAMVISTNAGLWRYMIGDTIRFTSLLPYRFRITGRTKSYINAFGEELIVDNAEEGLRLACAATGVSIKEYTAAPVYLEGKARGSHEWFIEFVTPPADPEHFADELDAALRRINSDYDAKRTADIALGRLKLNVCPTGTFYDFLKSKGKLGGQNKVPRLANDRQYADELAQFLKASK